MRLLVVPLVAGLVLTGCAQPPTTPTGSPPVTTDSVTAIPEVRLPPTISAQGKDVLSRAKRSGVETVVLTLATERDKTDQVVSALEGLGGTVEAGDSTVGYVRVAVPVDLAEQVPAVDGVSQIDVDEPLSNADPTP